MEEVGKFVFTLANTYMSVVVPVYSLSAVGCPLTVLLLCDVRVVAGY